MPDDFSRGFDKGLANAPMDLNASMGEIMGQKAGEQRRNAGAITVNLGRRAIGIAAAIIVGVAVSKMAPRDSSNHVGIGFVAAIFTYIIVMIIVKRWSKP